MLLNIVMGSIGVLVQISVFGIVALLTARPGGYSRAVLYGGVVSVYGFALLESLAALLSVPWQVLDALLAVGVILVLALPRTRRSILAERAGLLNAGARSAGALALAGLALLLNVVVAVIKPELSIDGQLYHGPVLAQIVRTGSLWAWPAPNQYMYYTDSTMAGGVNLSTFTGVTVFDDALQIPHLLLLMALINWALLRRFRSAFVRMSFAALIVSAPVIWLQARILYVDLAYGVAAASVVLLLILGGHLTTADVGIVGIMVAAVFSSKPTGILTGVLLLVLTLIVLAVRSRGVWTPGRTVLRLVVGIGVPLAMATSFYVRNLGQFGNPVYPVRVALGPIRLPGLLDLSVFASGDRGNGLADLSRWISYAQGILTGMVHGVAKPDYDPRAGGYGHVPLALGIVVILLVVVQMVRRRRGAAPIRGPWKQQIAIVAVAALIVLIQPSSFDSRYVIGPTVALLVALVLTEVATTPPWLELGAGILVLVVAIGQIDWTELRTFPGLKTVIDISHSEPAARPDTPGNPWGRSPTVTWLPAAGDCAIIALQTRGGVTSAGMAETSLLGTLPYALYGDSLCNDVIPVTLGTSASSAAVVRSARSARYLVVYQQDVARWRNILGDRSCIVQVDTLKAQGDFTQVETVLADRCP